MTQRITNAVVERVDSLLDNDQTCNVAAGRFYAATAKLEELDGNLFDELDAAYIAMLDATISAAWLDGWQCGRNPDLLVMGPADGGDE